MVAAASKVDKETCIGKHSVVDERVTAGLVGGVLLLQQSVGNITSQLKLMSDEHYSSRIAELENEIRYLKKGQKFPWVKVTLAMLGISSGVVILASALMTLALKVLFVNSS